MTGESLRDRQRAQIRADISLAAFRLFIERGYDAVTTEEIATAAGVSPRTLFRHVPTKEELLLAPVRHGGAAIVNLLEQQPAGESRDVALITAIITRTRSFDEADCRPGRRSPAGSARAAATRSPFTPRPIRSGRSKLKLIAERMGANPNVDIRPGLFVQLAFAAADFGFQQWVRQAMTPRPLDRYVTEALEAIKSPHWKKKVKL